MYTCVRTTIYSNHFLGLGSTMSVAQFKTFAESIKEKPADDDEMFCADYETYTGNNYYIRSLG